MIAEAELTGLQPDDSLQELGRSAFEADGVEVAADREQFRHAAVELGLVHLQRGHHGGGLLIGRRVHGVYDGMARERYYQPPAEGFEAELQERLTRLDELRRSRDEERDR